MVQVSLKNAVRVGALWLTVLVWGCVSAQPDEPGEPGGFVADEGFVDPDRSMDAGQSPQDVRAPDDAPEPEVSPQPDVVEGETPDLAPDPEPGALDPPALQSSGGQGGAAARGTAATTAEGGVSYRIIAPGGAGPHPLMIVYSGTEGGQQMTQNLISLGPATNTGSFVFAVLDGVQYRGDGQAGARVLDDVRALYDIDNDRTYLLSESAGTSAGLELGLRLRQSYFAAYWANDVNQAAVPRLNAEALGFAPFGNAGPGGDFPDANTIVDGMRQASYRTPDPAPYDGPGSNQHGSPDQFIAALRWFPGKTRQ